MSISVLDFPPESQTPMFSCLRMSPSGCLAGAAKLAYPKPDSEPPTNPSNLLLISGNGDSIPTGAQLQTTGLILDCSFPLMSSVQFMSTSYGLCVHAGSRISTALLCLPGPKPISAPSTEAASLLGSLLLPLSPVFHSPQSRVSF